MRKKVILILIVLLIILNIYLFVDRVHKGKTIEKSVALIEEEKYNMANEAFQNFEKKVLMKKEKVNDRKFIMNELKNMERKLFNINWLEIDIFLFNTYLDVSLHEVEYYISDLKYGMRYGKSINNHDLDVLKQIVDSIEKLSSSDMYKGEDKKVSIFTDIDFNEGILKEYNKLNTLCEIEREKLREKWRKQ